MAPCRSASIPSSATCSRSAAERLATANTKLDTAGNDVAKRTSRLAVGRLEVLRRLAAPGADDVVWVERGTGRNKRVRIAPVATGDTIGRFLLTQRPVIAVSATLGGAPPFTALATQLGLQTSARPGAWGVPDDDGRRTSNAGLGYVAVQTPSSFDWRSQGMLYVAKDLPDPGRAREAWLEQAGDRVCDLVNAAGGRALVLCTSNANVKHFAELLRERTDHHILEQGTRESGGLAQAFIEDEASVLVGTRTFWAGIDAVGAACVLVAIDRIPFPPPDEPMHAARRTRAEQRGLSAFAAVDLPAAALILAQGAGRLLRTASDHGVVAVLDPRLAVRNYREQLLAAMPPLRRSIDLGDACAFLEHAAANASVVRPQRSTATIAPTSTSADPRTLRTDLSTTEKLAIRNAVACDVCDAEISERCRDGNGTSAFLHEGRVRLANP